MDVHGGLLFRGFNVRTPVEFDRFITVTAGAPVNYMERSSPRTRVEGNIYTSTDYPANQAIFLHNEQSYNRQFPLRIYFCCLQPAATGGETPIADCRRVYARLRPATIERFRAGYLYVRNFGAGVGLAWQEAFQTQEKNRVEEYCANNSIECRWLPGDGLRTQQLRRAMATHPRTAQTVWFNHCTFFHVSTLPVIVQEVLRMQPEGLPNQTYFADGSEIAPDILDELRAAYQAETRAFKWELGDVLMLVNMMVAHGRRPFSGPRKVVVGMADLYTWDSV